MTQDTATYRSMQDEVLVSMTLLGRQDAYEELVRRYQKLVLHSAYLILHSRFLAEDAAQDAFLTAWTRLDALRDPARFGPWVYRIAENRAKNMARHWRDYLPEDTEEAAAMEDRRDYTLWQTEQAEEAASDSLNQCLARLSEKIRTVIRLHYFEGLSVSEISLRLSIPQGTVKYRLHEGRETLRKELTLMNGNEMEKFVKEVMRKVELLKRWGHRRDKTGFAAYYREVLAEVEKIPEEGYAREKNHAMADVLMRGFWWLPDGEKGDSDELVARIRTCCEASRNEDVMEFLLWHDMEKFHGTERLDFIRNTQIPMLEKEGYVQALGYALFWLGRFSHEITGKTEEMFACWHRVLDILKPSDVYYANATAAIRLMEVIGKLDGCNYYHGGATGEQYRMIDGKLIFDKQPGFSCGELLHTEEIPESPLYYLSRCDSRFPEDTMTPGETCTSTDGKASMTFLEDGITVETPCGIFTGCQKWKVDGSWKGEAEAILKPGVGLIRFTQRGGTIVLRQYTVNGGTGLFPMAQGNRWEYTAPVDNPLLDTWETYEVTYADGERFVLSAARLVSRTGFADTVDEQMLRVRAEYVDAVGEREFLAKDVRPILAHAAELAVTPYEKAYTAAACEVMEEIWSTDPEANPGCRRKGHWNFFSPFRIFREGDTLQLRHMDYHFEWKDSPMPYELLHNWIYDILQDAVGCVWSDKWADGYTDTLQQNGKTAEVKAENIGTVTVPAGTYENCLRLTVDVRGFHGGLSYRDGLMTYDYAPGVGIVQVRHRFTDNGEEKYSRYVLTEAVGTGEGYMPHAAGLRRRYLLADVPETVQGGTSYAWEENPDGTMVLIAALRGSRTRTEEEIAKDTAAK